MSIDPRPQITPALTIRPMSKALEFAIASAIKEREEAALSIPVTEIEDTTDARSGAILDRRS